MKERLQKILAAAGLCSRRQAEKHIKNGEVKVDGKIVTKLGSQADPATQRIEFRGRPIPSPKKICLLLNKPRGYVTTMKDPQGRPLVTDLLKGIKERVFPVGRLDLETEGALLLTNDGDLAQRILHPSFEINRTYEAVVAAAPSPKKLASLRNGLLLDGRMTWPAQLRIIKKHAKSTRIEIIIHEGRKRQVRKMFAAVGHPVIALKRLAYGPLELGNLRVGKFRVVSRAEIAKLLK